MRTGVFGQLKAASSDADPVPYATVSCRLTCFSRSSCDALLDSAEASEKPSTKPNDGSKHARRTNPSTGRCAARCMGGGHAASAGASARPVKHMNGVTLVLGVLNSSKLAVMDQGWTGGQGSYVLVHGGLALHRVLRLQTTISVFEAVLYL